MNGQLGIEKAAGPLDTASTAERERPQSKFRHNRMRSGANESMDIDIQYRFWSKALEDAELIGQKVLI